LTCQIRADESSNHHFPSSFPFIIPLFIRRVDWTFFYSNSTHTSLLRMVAFIFPGISLVTPGPKGGLLKRPAKTQMR
jgi:hypothetical protein